MAVVINTEINFKNYLNLFYLLFQFNMHIQSKLL